MAHVSKSLVDQLNGPLIKLLEVVRRMSDLVGGIAQPLDHVFDADKELFLFFLGIGVIVAKITSSLVSSSVAEIDVDRFGVPNVEDAVGFWGKSSANLAARYLQMRLE